VNVLRDVYKSFRADNAPVPAVVDDTPTRL